MNVKTGLKLAAVMLFLQGVAQAETVVTSVFNVYESKKSESILLLSGVDGRIYKMAKNKKTLAYLKAFQGQIVELSYSENAGDAVIGGIRKVSAAEVNPQVYDLNHFQYNQLRKFAPTDLQSEEKAKEIFDGMLNDGDKRSSQCFKRAHMWAFDMWSKLGIQSQKLFLFYTPRFQQLQDEKWWFHVAPMVVANGVEYVLDGTFMEKPMPVKEWTNFFIKTDKISCPVITNLTEYDKNSWSRLCFTMKLPMYHFSPQDIYDRDEKGMQRNGWMFEELKDARRAFKGWESTYEGLDDGKETTKF